MKNLLVPTDFSVNTHTALNYAIDLANQFGGKITLLNTYKLQQRAGVFLGVERLMKHDALKEMAEQIEQFSPKLKGEASLEGKVVKGEAISTIVRAAKKLDVAMIVMGTQGASGLKEVFIGSTTNGVIKAANVPVLAVPSVYDYRSVDNIVFSADAKVGGTTEQVIAPLKIFARHYKAEIHVLHINTNNQEGDIKQEVQQLLADVKHSFTEEPGEVAKLSEYIEDFIQKTGADMLCMVRHTRGFWAGLFHNSVTTKEVFHSSVPILVLQD